VNDSIGIGDLAALITTVGVAIYVLGLIGLAIPMRSVTKEKDRSTAWYATSLIPRTVVAGQGASIYLGTSLILTISMILVSLVTQAIYPDATAWVTALILTVFGLFYAGRTLPDKWYWPGNALIVFGIWIMAFGISALLDGRSSNLMLPLDIAHYVMGSSLVFESIMVVFVGAFIVGLPLAVTAHPPLLEVRIDMQAEGSATEGAGTSLKGRLVSHGDGFWHLFDKDAILLSIPDDRVISVQIPGRPHGREEAASVHTDPEEDTEPSVEKIQ
jgi:hypothetical protein